jgi:predicted Fe-S protein YdhL (DUF1289 family)
MTEEAMTGGVPSDEATGLDASCQESTPPSRPGPIRVGSGTAESPTEAATPTRRFACHHYNSCLSLAAVLNWDSFSCRGCSGEIDEAVRWRAKSESRRDATLKRLCVIPNPPIMRSSASSRQPGQSGTTIQVNPIVNLRSVGPR